MALLSQKRLRRVADIEEIRQCLAQHSRGIDRKISSLVSTSYHPGSEVAYGFFDGAAEDFADIVTASPGESPVTLHRTSNQWIQVRGDQAVSESYVIAYMGAPEEAGGPLHTLIGGRYLDQHENKDGVWRLIHRRYLLDWNVNWPHGGSLQRDFTSTPYGRGAHGAADLASQGIAAWRVRVAGVKTTDPHAGNKEDSQMENNDQLAQRVHRALARQDIHDLIMAQARGTDRHDVALLQSSFHDDATVDIGVYEGPASDYPQALMDVIADISNLAHSVANEWIEVDGDHAIAESYVIAHASVAADDSDQLTGGRYLDEFECRAGIWKFVSRGYVLDWSIEQPSTDDSTGDMLGALQRGGQFPDDPVYALWSRGNH